MTVRLLKKKTIHLKKDRKHNEEANPSYKLRKNNKTKLGTI